MGNIVNIIIAVGLQSDVEGGEIAFLVLPLPEKVAEGIIREQEDSSLLAEGGPLSEMLNAYAVLIGYQHGWFVRAELIREDNDDE